MFRFAAARCFLVVTTTLGYVLSDGAFLYELLSSRQPTVSAQNVASPRVLRVSTTPALMLSAGSRV
jgi:hypothetical protein